jgi:hypothetical protein
VQCFTNVALAFAQFAHPIVWLGTVFIAEHRHLEIDAHFHKRLLFECQLSQLEKFADRVIGHQSSTSKNLLAKQLDFSRIDMFFDEVYGAELHGLNHSGHDSLLAQRYYRGVLAQSPDAPN